MNLTKRCRVCNNEIILDLLVKHKKSSHGFEKLCKTCDGKIRKSRLDPSRERARKREIARKWRAANPDKNRIKVLTYLARKANVSGSFSCSDVHDLHKTQEGLCYICHKQYHNNYHIDHIVSLSAGGSNWPSNLALACANCNLRKGKKSLSEFLALEQQ